MVSKDFYDVVYYHILRSPKHLTIAIIENRIDFVKEFQIVDYKCATWYYLKYEMIQILLERDWIAQKTHNKYFMEAVYRIVFRF